MAGGPKHRGGDVPAFGKADPHTIAIAPKAQQPATSWWVGVETREEFAERHRAQLVRINGTGFGRRQALITQRAGDGS